MKPSYRLTLFLFAAFVLTSFVGASWLFAEQVLVGGAALEALDPASRAQLAAHLRWWAAAATGFGLVFAWAIGAVASNLTSRTLRELVDHSRSVAHGTDTRPLQVAIDSEASGLAGPISSLREELERNVATLASERDRFEAVLDGMSEAVMALDDPGNIVLANRAARAMLGLPGSPVGTPVGELEDFPATLTELVASTEDLVTATTEFDLVGPVTRRVMARATRKRASGGLIIVMHDVTELRRLETIRRDFIANVSHELRTPVSVIQANAETLLDGALEDTRFAHSFVDAIYRNSERLSRLIADLLDISRLEADKYELDHQSVPVALAVRRAAEAVEGKIDREMTNIVFDIDGNLTAWCDPKALDQVLLNLLDNAVKHMPDGGRVEIVAAAEDAVVVIEVRDNGPGVEPKHRDRLFERFYRVDKGRSSHMGGTGLGLSIVKHLVSTMGGNVGFRPNSPRGSIFWFTLPDARHEQAPAPDDAQPCTAPA